MARHFEQLQVACAKSPEAGYKLADRKAQNKTRKARVPNARAMVDFILANPDAGKAEYNAARKARKALALALEAKLGRGIKVLVA